MLSPVLKKTHLRHKIFLWDCSRHLLYSNDNSRLEELEVTLKHSLALYRAWLSFFNFRPFQDGFLQACCCTNPSENMDILDDVCVLKQGLLQTFLIVLAQRHSERCFSINGSHGQLKMAAGMRFLSRLWASRDQPEARGDSFTISGSRVCFMQWLQQTSAQRCSNFDGWHGQSKMATFRRLFCYLKVQF